jgi:uncharacterized repeat protein (TIGR03803 family)
MKKLLLFSFTLALLSMQLDAQSVFIGSSMTNNGAYGTVFTFNTGGNSFNNVFNNSTFNGWFNSGIIKSSDGRFFATGYDGGTLQTGAILQINPYINGIATVAEFNGGTDGAYPQGPMVSAADGYLYGMCKQGGANGSGNIYRYDPNLGIITGVYDFGTVNGHTPMGGLIEVGGLFYGLTSMGGANDEGVIFSYDYTLDTYTVLYDFDFATGSGPRGSFILASDGDLYATLHDGTSTSRGGIVKLDLPSNTVTTSSFAFGSEPQDPDGDLISDGGSLLYGTTTIGGAYNYGTLYSYDITSNAVTVLRSFDNTTVMGGFPKGTPVLAVYDGKMYGLANGGGALGNGVVYQYDPVFDNYVKMIDVGDVTSTDFGTQKLIEYHPFVFNAMNLIQNDPCNDGNCEGAAVVSVSGGTGIPNFSWLPSGEGDDTAVVLCAGTHTVTITEPGGGYITQTITITEPSTPLSLGATALSASCSGAATGSANSAAAGGTPPYTYSWSTGGSLSTENNMPPGTHTAYVMDNNGCGANFPVNIGSNTTYILGHISTPSDDTADVGTGAAYLFKYQPGSAGFDTMDIAGINTVGDYYFYFADSGQYLVKVIFDEPFYPLSVPTYYGNTFQWDSSTVVNHGCTVHDTVNIHVMEVDTTQTGPGIISGYVIEEAGFGTGRLGPGVHPPDLPFVPGGPLKGIDVKLGKNPAGGIQARTMTDSTGFYVFDNLPLEDYKIFVDIPNLPMDSTREISLTAGNTLSEQNNYFADSASVYVIDTMIAVGIYSSEKAYDNKFSIFPNPASTVLNLQFTIAEESAAVSFEISNAMGQLLHSERKQTYNKGDNTLSVNARELNLGAGVYFVSLLTENRKYTQRIVVVE